MKLIQYLIVTTGLLLNIMSCQGSTPTERILLEFQSAIDRQDSQEIRIIARRNPTVLRRLNNSERNRLIQSARNRRESSEAVLQELQTALRPRNNQFGRTQNNRPRASTNSNTAPNQEIDVDSFTGNPINTDSGQSSPRRNNQS